MAMNAESSVTGAPRPSRWTAGRIVLVVLGSIAVLLGAALLAGGGALLWADQTQRDDDGFLSTPTELFSSNSYAIVSEPIDLVEADAGDWLWEDVLGDVRVRASGGDLFVGVGPTREIDGYLRGVEYDRLTDVNYDPFSADYEREGGDAPARPPGDEEFWVEIASGSGEQTLTWNAEPGNWSVVVMNSDGSRGIAADVSVGAEASWIVWVAIGVLVAGALFLLGGAAMIFFGARHAAAPTTVAAAAPGAAVAADAALIAGPAYAEPTVYPVALAGELQPGLSRWLWLVKWLLALPHYVVLALLWIAVSVLTLVAAFAILFTRRYPRGIFDFNLGVLRWSWRVWFYSYWANGTDRYPPFSLREEPDYPARLHVAYPERLNRWLPLVKWLLAIPHLILVGIFVGGWGWAWGPGDDWGGWGIAGLVGLLVVIACVVLLFTGRYPPALFDFTLGLDRWAFRVAAYVGLMTDEYPPFRLDMGPHEPRPTREVGDDRAHAPA
jgi:Domain of unknown function (DUF4389)